MEFKIKPMLSAMAIGAFLCFALASDLLDESTNTLVQAENCKAMPQVSGNLDIKVEYHDEDNFPVHGAAGTLFITHQIIVDTMNCMYDNISASIEFHLDANGKYEYHNNLFVHDNDEDLFRVEIEIPAGENADQDWNGFRSVEVAKYNQDLILVIRNDPPAL